MNYQMLVLDIDGTLTNSQKEISTKTKDALLDLQKRGIKLVLASGRPTAGMLKYAETLQLKEFGNYILSYNGARITNLETGETVYNRTLPAEAIPELFEIAKAHNVGLVTYDPENNAVTGMEPDPYMIHEAKINGLPLKQLDNFVQYIDFPVNKCLMTGEPEVLEGLIPIIQNRFHGLINAYRSEPFFLEITPNNIDKAHSLLKLLTSLGLTQDQMICCGDGYNDISMLVCAGLGVAMANAQPPVKEAADIITLSNDEDGLLPVIETYFK